MAIILKANKVNLFVSSVLFVFWYHSPNFLDTPHMKAALLFPLLHNVRVSCTRPITLAQIVILHTFIEEMPGLILDWRRAIHYIVILLIVWGEVRNNASDGLQPRFFFQIRPLPIIPPSTPVGDKYQLLHITSCT
jgi:hypothetical protein